MCKKKKGKMKNVYGTITEFGKTSQKSAFAVKLLISGRKGLRTGVLASYNKIREKSS